MKRDEFNVASSARSQKARKKTTFGKTRTENDDNGEEKQEKQEKEK